MGTQITVDSDDVKKMLDVYISTGRNIEHVSDGCDDAWERLSKALPMPEVYINWFNSESINWAKDSDLNRVFLQAQENYFNHLLLARGHVFLNEIYDALGFDRIARGQLVGWSNTANKISFGIPEQELYLDVRLVFNVEGEIYKELDD